MRIRYRGLKRVYVGLIFLFMYAPIALLIVQSFNQSKSRGRWGGFTLQWYSSLFSDESIIEAFTNTITLALLSSVISVVIGTAAVIWQRMPTLSSLSTES